MQSDLEEHYQWPESDDLLPVISEHFVMKRVTSNTNLKTFCSEMYGENSPDNVFLELNSFKELGGGICDVILMDRATHVRLCSP